jgi:hypothetical protein
LFNRRASEAGRLGLPHGKNGLAAAVEYPGKEVPA